MARVILIFDRGNERDYQIPNGRIITLVYDEWDYTIRFKENNQYIGDEFKFVDEDVDEDGIGNGESYLLARMYSPVPKSGLGREAIKFLAVVLVLVIRKFTSHLTCW